MHSGGHIWWVASLKTDIDEVNTLKEFLEIYSHVNDEDKTDVLEYLIAEPPIKGTEIQKYIKRVLKYNKL